jgi:predicted DNA-binding transcriptional regulator AlpA
MTPGAEPTREGRVIDIATYRQRREPEPLLKMRDLIERFGWSERWWRYRIAEGMPVLRWGGGLRFRATEIEAWMEERYADAR